MVRRTAPCFCDHCQCLLLLSRHAHLQLQQGACSRKGLFEELQGIIIVEDLDGVRKRNHLLSTNLHVCLVISLLRCAVCVHVLQELSIFDQSLLSVTQVFLHLHNLHAQISNAHSLRFDCSCQTADLFLFSGHQLLVRFDSSLLSCLCRCEALIHCFKHLLEYPNNLTAGWSIPVSLRSRQKRHELFTIVVSHRVQVGDHVTENLCAVSLQEACHALLEGIDGFRQGGNIGVDLCLLLCECGGFLFSEASCLGHCSLCCISICLMLLQIFLQLRNCGFRLLDV
mmetsp:Transcript_55755/g.97330  ORF Transcript_55755/g.97330 Transcript_55755/m.97330 type:complete len:283 (-) Transcript_55755:332-1180(-)